MQTLENMIEISQYDDAGYQPLVDFNCWRIAVLNYIDELEPDRIDNFQKHDETDEVFILLEGRCILFVGEANEQQEIVNIRGVDMTPNRLYNIKQGVYHTHTLSEDAKVLIVENRNTCEKNSPKIGIKVREQARLMRLTRQLWCTEN